MSTITDVQTEEETIELSVDLPTKEEFVACTQCGHRSYMHFWYHDDLMSFCKNHGERNQEKIEEQGATLVFDNRDSLIENRLKADS